jgi:hypothetical protein
MKKIDDYKYELFEVYKTHFEGCNENQLEKEFNQILKLDYKYMPWWFVEYCFDFGITFKTSEE